MKINGHDADDSMPAAKKSTILNRRGFFGRAGGVAATLAASSLTASTATAAAEPATGFPGVALPPGASNNRVVQAFTLRVGEAIADALVPAAKNVNNGDDALYPDKGGTYTKGLPHDQYGRVDLNAYATFKNAISTGRFSDYAKIITNDAPHTLNNPQGALLFDLEGLDGVQFGQPAVPPAPPIAGDQSGTELLEHYWAALLRDVAFSDYSTNALASQAAAELSGMPTYVGPRNSTGQVTPNLLFRGIFTGGTLGPYVSQFLLTPTTFGVQPISQLMTSYLPDIDFMTSFSDWLTVQNGLFTGGKNSVDTVLRYRRNGRDLAAYTHVDVLYQAYFMALLVLQSAGAPLNPGNPYIGSTNQNGFSTFGGPDFASMVEIADKALCAVWYQKWNVHLRPRPEATGGQVHLVKTGQGQFTDVKPSHVVLNSVGLQQTFNKYGTWLLPQAFPEGSPTHPAYPTGHGVVGGACITMLKFFFDGSHVLTSPVQPSSDGLTLVPYTGGDQLTVNGELNKLAENITFGHGIHGGIHWRSDSDTSLLLGEAVALSYLNNKAKTYNEPFTIHLTKLDGTTATISNKGNE
jgi:hypothetical protein